MRTLKHEVALMHHRLDGIRRMSRYPFTTDTPYQHIGYVTATLAAGGQWADGMLHRRPWTWANHPRYIDLEEWANGSRYRRLVPKWEGVQTCRDSLGLARFDEVMRATNYAPFYVSHLDQLQAWDSNAAALRGAWR